MPDEFVLRFEVTISTREPLNEKGWHTMLDAIADARLDGQITDAAHALIARELPRSFTDEVEWNVHIREVFHARPTEGAR